MAVGNFDTEHMLKEILLEHKRTVHHLERFLGGSSLAANVVGAKAPQGALDSMGQKLPTDLPNPRRCGQDPLYRSADLRQRQLPPLFAPGLLQAEEPDGHHAIE